MGYALQHFCIKQCGEVWQSQRGSNFVVGETFFLAWGKMRRHQLLPCVDSIPNEE